MLLALTEVSEGFLLGGFSGLLSGVVLSGLLYLYLQRQGSRGRRIATRLKHHLGSSPYELPVVTKVASLSDLPGLHAAIEDLGGEDNQSIIILGMTASLSVLPRLAVAVNTGRWEGIYAERLTYDTFDLGDGKSLRFPKNALYLIRSEGHPIAIQVMMHGPSPSILVMAQDADQAEAFHRRLAERQRVCSVYRGRILSVEAVNSDDGYSPGWSKIKLHHFPQVQRNDVVLPESTRDLIERNTVRFFEHAAALKAHGYSAKRGLLFHGPPGTGKTHVLRWLRSSMPGVTVMLVTGEQQLQIKECIRYAKWLAPSLVLIEDVDLIAQSRDHSVHNPLLHQLMNEMDGLTPEEEVIFILTTNRPDDLEAAITNRPGRIDQAVHFGLPSPEERRKLIELFARRDSLKLQDFSQLIQQTEGATPAFLKELVRKAALVALEENSSGGILLRDHHFQMALKELTSGDGSLSRKLLGFSR